MSEICLSIKEQALLVELIANNTELAANFIDSLDEHNITKHKQEYTKAMLRCYHASKELGTLIARIQHNITEVNNDSDSRQSV